MKKFSWILALLAALAMVFVGCGGGGSGTEEPKTEDTLVLADNFQYGHGYQVTVPLDDFIPGVGQIKAGDEFVVKFKVSADRDLEDTLNVGLVDPSEAASYWQPLSWVATGGGQPTLIGKDKTTFLEADEVFEVDVTWVALVNSTGAAKDKNMIVFMTSGSCKKADCATNCDWTGAAGELGSGVKGPVTLTLTDISITKGKAAEDCCDDCDLEKCKDCVSGACTTDTECEKDCCMPPLTGPLSLTKFTSAERVSGYGDNNTSGNEWEINGGYQAVRFGLGGIVTGENYKAAVITYSTDAVGTVSFRFDGATVATIPGGYQGKIDLPAASTTVTVTIPADAILDEIAFESKAAVDDEDPATAEGGMITITITSVVFTENK